VLTEKKHNAIPAIRPIAQHNLIMVSSFFGKRFDPFFHEEADHFGLDLVAPVGSEVYATGDGTVTLLNFSRTGYGNELVINHSFGYSTRYAHLEKFFVSEGESVKRGQLIGAVGNSGRSTGPHLHYEVLYEGKPVNPVFYYSDDLTDNEFHLLTSKTN
jgi:murein DD-endopeptidase MepM/ murein hydrolase activator NlpD